MYNKSIQAEMEDCANDYLNLWNTNEDRLHSMTRMEQETQGFWESENLVLERQEKMGIAVTLDMAPYEWKNGVKSDQDHFGIVTPKQIGDNHVGVSQRIVTVNRNIWKNGQLIKNYKDICDCRVNLLKNNVDKDNKVACPNCGGFGTIESYADGCDYCGSKFSVNYFKSKVSGFSLIESLNLRADRWRNKSFFAYIIIFLVVFFLDFFAMSFIGMSGITSVSTSKYNSGIADWLILFFVSKNMTLILPKCFFLVFISFIISMFVVRKSKTYNNMNLAYSIVPDFNENEFAQEVEHRLKCLIMAETSTQLELISDCDSLEFANRHKDVFDLTISSLNILSAQFNPATQDDCISVEAMVKLYRNNGRRVKETYEKVVLNVAKHRSSELNQRINLRQYKCPSCGNNINIFRGCTCEFCKKPMDKFSLGWVVQGVTSAPTVSLYRVFPWIIAVIAILLFII